MGNTLVNVKERMEGYLIKDKVYGKALITDNNLTIVAHVDNINHGLFDIGQILKYEIFRDYPDFVLTTIIVSSKPIDGIGGFANPKSHWFNAIIGVSRIDFPAEAEGRPFGFTPRSEICGRDLLLYSKAMFNYIACYTYGVPIDECVKNTPLTGDEEVRIVARSARGKEHVYSEVEITNLISVSGYYHKRELLNNNPEITGVWQKMLGKQYRSKKYNTSFYPVRMKIRLLVRYEKCYNPTLESYQYCTYIKLGSVKMSGIADDDIPIQLFHDDFLQLQVNTLKNMGTPLPFIDK